VISVLAIVTAAALALASRGRPWTWGPVVVCAALSAMVCAIIAVRHFRGEPDTWWLLPAPIALLLAGMVFVAGRSLMRVATLLALVALPAAVIVPYLLLLILGEPVANGFTAAAGSPPVHGGDVDILLSFNLFLIGVVTAFILLAVTRVKRAPVAQS